MLFIPKRWIIGIALVGWILVLNYEHEGSLAPGGLGIGTEQQSGVQKLVPCVVRVSADQLNVRTGPGTQYPVVGSLDSGAIVPAARSTQGSFRQLGPGRYIGRWASAEFLRPVPGAHCD